jgi:hypothetical protein
LVPKAFFAQEDAFAGIRVGLEGISFLPGAIVDLLEQKLGKMSNVQVVEQLCSQSSMI